MQVKLNDFLQSHKKASGLASVEKFVDSIAKTLPMDKKATFRLSLTGGEIHSGESTVNRLHSGETLQQKIARFDKLRQSVAAQRSVFAFVGQMQEQGDADDDFEFEQGDDFDDFGDPIVKSPVMPSESTEDVELSDGKAPAPNNAGAPENRENDASAVEDNTPDE